MNEKTARLLRQFAQRFKSEVDYPTLKQVWKTLPTHKHRGALSTYMRNRLDSTKATL